MTNIPKYITLEKAVGETPLSCAEAYRAEHPELEGVSMAYAGRLDPMASGKLLILLGEECKNQTNYHGLDKEYEFSVLLGIESDSQDVMGRLSSSPATPPVWALQGASPSLTQPGCAAGEVDDVQSCAGVRLGQAARSAPEKDSNNINLDSLFQDLVGEIKLPYPIFSSKTVKGKPLHTWTMEGRLDEIEIPTKESEVYELEFTKLESLPREAMVEQALAKVNSVPPVTELRKALGNDFRREDIRKDWNKISKDDSLPDTYQITHFRCVASSGTYMRTLASEIGKKLGAVGLAWHIHRTKIGTFNLGSRTWEKEY